MRVWARQWGCFQKALMKGAEASLSECAVPAGGLNTSNLPWLLLFLSKSVDACSYFCYHSLVSDSSLDLPSQIENQKSPCFSPPVRRVPLRHLAFWAESLPASHSLVCRCVYVSYVILCSMLWHGALHNSLLSLFPAPPLSSVPLQNPV